MHDIVVVLDFGSQVTQLIARRVREAGVYCEVLPCDVPVAEVRMRRPTGLILSGGPASVFGVDAPRPDPGVYDLGVPILGICYGLQVTAQLKDGEVAPAAEREYGETTLRLREEHPLFADTPTEQTVWMSHGDTLSAWPGARVLAESDNCPLAAVAVPELAFYGVQFHPEVHHTPAGPTILANFLFRICGCRGDWRMEAFVAEETARIRERVGADHVLLGLSGGVDSSVAAVLLHRAIGDRLHCVFVDNGVLRKGEAESVRRLHARYVGDGLVYHDAGERFLAALAGVADPEHKRKIIGREFIAVFKEEAARLQESIDGEIRFIAQGTLYPDVIESRSVHGGPAAVIKSHHNVGGLPDDLGLELVEPFKFLFKDEVRAIGTSLGLPEDLVWRHPFPGPGLAVRILGEVTAERVTVLQEADAIFREELERAGLGREVWQAFVVLLPVKTVGVMGDDRTYEKVCALRAITSTDGMTADWYQMPHAVLGRMANRIINEVRGINRVVYDVSSKPPATIEWE